MTIETFSTEREASDSEIGRMLEKLKERDPESKVYNALKDLDDENQEKLDRLLSQEGYNFYTLGASTSKDNDKTNKVLEIIDRVKNFDSDDNEAKKALLLDIRNVIES